MPIADLRDWISTASAAGELVVVNAQVDHAEEMSGIAFLSSRSVPSPALLFTGGQNPVGMRHLWNIYGSSVRRTAISLEQPVDTPVMELIRKTKGKLSARIPPKEVARENAHLFEHTITGDRIDLTALPFPKHWPGDGGFYAGTADAVFTRDYDTDVVNIGTYRMMIQGPKQVGLSIAPGKDALAHMHQAWSRGEPLPVAAAWGIDPLFMIVGSQSFPRDVSEYEHAGGIKGVPIEVVRAPQTGIYVPASAEFVIEGFIYPQSFKDEGPFGEFTGYYGFRDKLCPLIDVVAIHHRSEPILTNALMATYPSNEQGAFFSVIRSARIWNDLDAIGLQGIRGVYAPPAAAGGFGMVIISLDQKYPGHSAQALALAAQVPSAAYITKWIIAVDGDIDPTDWDQIAWAMSTRANPVDAIDILRNTRGSPLDPAQYPVDQRLFSSKALINACIDYRTLKYHPQRTLLNKAVHDAIYARWSELGLRGAPPTIQDFDTSPEIGVK